MALFDDLLAINWPEEFVIEYADGIRERLLRDRGVALVPPDDDPDGTGCLCADLPQKHLRNQKQRGRLVRFTELRGIYTTEGHRLWPVA